MVSDNARLDVTHRKIVVETADGKTEDIAYFIDDYTGKQNFKVEDMQWVEEKWEESWSNLYYPGRQPELEQFGQ